MPRLVRRAPLSQRIKAYLDPWDFLLWLSEELNSTEWEDFLKEWSIPLGVGINLIFIVARANSRADSLGDDVFGDLDSLQGTGWRPWIVSLWSSWMTRPLLTRTVFVPCLFPIYRVLRECLLHLRPYQALPTVRGQHRCPAFNPIRSPSPRRFSSHVILSHEISYKLGVFEQR
jgi:hypothetical protein